MKFTAEQFEELGGEIYCDDYPLNFDYDLSFKIFNDMPRELQGEIVKWGFQDCNEEIFIWLCENQLSMTSSEYYESEVADNYFENDIFIEYKTNLEHAT